MLQSDIRLAQEIAQFTASDVLTPEALEILKIRAELWVQCRLDPATRAAAMRMCMVGNETEPPYLYFFRMFANIWEPRNPPDFQRLPFVPYGYQISELEIIHRAVNSGMGVTGTMTLVLWLKSRDMGMTWLVLIYFLWDWLFNKGTFHIGSFKENEVDVLGSPQTLFGKIRNCLYSLPEWMLPKDLEDKTLLLSHSHGEAAISGESANKGFGRSKRAKAVLMDEFQKWEHDRAAMQSSADTSNVRFLVGTPLGYGNYYGEIARKKAMPSAVIRKVHWVEHPLKAKGLQYVDGKPTSPWYEMKKSELPAEVVAAELDLAFESSQKGPVFASSYGIAHQKRNLVPLPGLPIYRGWDLGGWSAVILLQIDLRIRRVRIYREVVEEGTKLSEIVDQVLKYSEELARLGQPIIDVADWNDLYQFEDIGDPSGATTNKSNQLIPEYQELWEKHQISVDYLGMAAMPTGIRIRSRNIQIINCMQRYVATNSEETDGPGLWIDVDQCPVLDEAFRGGYRKKVNDLTGGVSDTIEERHPYVDVVDALGYVCVEKLGIPEQVKREAKQKKSEEQEEDEDQDGLPRKRNRC